MGQDNEYLIIEYKNENDNSIIGKCIIPLKDLGFGNSKEYREMLNPSGNIHLFLQINKKDIIPFQDINLLSIINPYMTFYIKIISGRDIPVADDTGLSDPFCILELKNRKEKKKTLIRKQTLTPVWNQNFQFKILSYNTDMFILSLYDYDKYSKNDFLGDWKINIRDIKPGIVEEKEIKAGGLINIKYHLAYANEPAYISKLFTTKTLYIKVIEGKEIKTSNISGLANLYCQMSIIGDIEYSTTSIKYETLSPTWNETFSFLTANFQTDIFRFELKEKGKDANIGDINIGLKEYENDKIYRKWLKLESKGKITALIKVEINLIETGGKSFNGELIEEKKEFKPSENWEVNIHLIKATKLPSADSNGLSDPYCLFKILNRDISIKSRRIDKTLNPEWDDYLNIPIKSLNSDIIRLEVLDWDRLGKDDKLCMRDFRLRDYIPGKIYHETFSLIPLAGNPGGSSIELSFQITPPSAMPFIPYEYDLEHLNIRIEEISSVITKSPLKNPKLYINLKLDTDSDEGFLTDIKDELNSICKEDFSFIIMDKNSENLMIEYKNEIDNSIIAKCMISLKNIDFGRTNEIKTIMEPSGNIHLFLELNKKNIKPFQDIDISPNINPYTTFYIQIKNGTNIPVADNTGLSDPFCILELKDRKEKKKTLIRKQTLTPVWNQTFQFKILSYNTDVFILTLFDYDKFSKNDFLGRWQINIRDLKPGIVKDTEINAGGKINVKYQLACSNQPQWENIEKPAYHLNVKVIEAKEFPNNAGKTDPFVQLFYKDDLYKKNTSTIDNSLTPQWFESFSFSFINLSEPLFIRLVDNNILNNSEMAEINLKKSDKYEFNYIYEEWIKMTPLGTYKIGGKIRLEIQFTDYNTKPFEGPRNPSPSLPISETKMTFNIKIIKGINNCIRDTYCKLEFLGRPESIKKTRIIEKSSTPFWDEFHQFEILSLSDIFQISLCDSKNEIISCYTINLKNCKFGITIETDLIMNKYSSRIDNPGKIYVIYQITKPCQGIFYSEQFDVDTITCYLKSFENSKQGEEYYCEVKTIDSVKGQFSKITTDNLIMEKFDLLMRPSQSETLEIIIYQLEKKGKFKISKEIKRIKYLIEELGEQYIDGIQFSLQMNEDPNTNYPKHPPILFSKRYVHILVKDCLFQDIDIQKRFKDSYMKISLNKKNKEKRYSEKTRVIYNEQNPIFNHIFHIPVYSLKEDVIKIKLYELKNDKKKEILVIENIALKYLKYGESMDKNINRSNCKINLTLHISEANEPPFTTKIFSTMFLNIKMFEIELKRPEKIDIGLQMKNDLNTYDKISCHFAIKRPVFGGNTLTTQISNQDDKFLLNAFYSESDKIHSSYEFETKDLEPYTIYRINKDGLRFWAQIVNEGDHECFNNNKFHDYYNRLPSECYVLYVEVIEFESLPKYDYTNLEIYYTISFGNQFYNSRTFYSNEYMICYDEYRFNAQNLEKKLHLDILYFRTKKLELDIDLTKYEFGKIVEEKYAISNNYSSIKIKWQVTEPCQPRWEEKILKINSLNLHIGKYQSFKNSYEFWKIIFDTIEEQTIITPCGAYNQTFSFILTNQTKLIFKQYLLDSDSGIKEGKTVNINFLDLKNNEPFIINEDLSGFIEIVPYKTPPFQGKNFSLYFTPKSIMSISILLKDGNRIDKTDKNTFILFKFKDRTFLNQKSIKIMRYNKLIWNQYFNFDVKSLDDILELHYLDDKGNELGKKEINVLSIDEDNLSCNLDSAIINIKIQLVPPNIQPFSHFNLFSSIEVLCVKILYGENIKTGDLYCQCKLINDIKWRKTETIKNCQNPQWNKIIILPICNLSDYFELEVNSVGLLGDTKLGYYKIGLEEISNEIEKKKLELKQGSVLFLIAKGKKVELEKMFEDYQEKDKIITTEKTTLAVKIIGVKSKEIDFSSSSVYCLLKLGKTIQKTRCVDYVPLPEWNQLFYFEVPSYSTCQLSIKIINNLKNNVLYEINKSICEMNRGIVEKDDNHLLNMITQLIGPGQNSFESSPFSTNTKLINIKNLLDNKNIYCMVKLKEDEYWRYTRPGKFNDYFTFDYIEQNFLIIKVTDGQMYSEENMFDINESKEYSIKNSFGEFRINFIDQIKIIETSPTITLYLYIDKVEKIPKKIGVLWTIEINNQSSGYSYDGNFNKYFFFPIISLVSDGYEIVLYREEKGKKLEYGKTKIYISKFQIGINLESSIKIKDLSLNFIGHISLPNKIPFINEPYNPLILYICAIEAYNLPSKSNPYVSCRLDRDLFGVITKTLEKTSTPQWFEFIQFIVTDENEDLIIEIYNKNGTKSKIICKSKLSLKKYLNGEIYYEWIKMDKVILNIAIQIKRKGEKYMTIDDINKYMDSSIPDNI